MSKVIDFDISSIRHLDNEQIGLRVSWKLAKSILSEKNVIEPELSQLVALMRILKQIGRTSTNPGKEIEYAAAIAIYQHITGKTTNTEIPLKTWIESIGASISSMAHPKDAQISQHRAGFGLTHKKKLSGECINVENSPK